MGFINGTASDPYTYYCKYNKSILNWSRTIKQLCCHKVNQHL